MYRNLQITINEAPPQGRRRAAAAYLPGQAGYDPGSPPESMTDPSNPGDPPESMTDPSNPGDPPESMTDPSNPEGYPLTFQTSAASGPVVTAVESTGFPAPVCCCGGGEAKKSIPDRPGVRAGDYSGFVIVRTIPGLELADGTGRFAGAKAGSARSLFELAEILGLDALKAVLELELDGTPGSSDDGDGSGAAAGGQGGTGGAQSLAGVAASQVAAPGTVGAAGKKAAKWAKKKDWKGGGEVPPYGGGDDPEGPAPARDGKLVSRPLIDLRPLPPTLDSLAAALTRPETVQAIRDLEQTAAQTTFRPLHSLNAYWRVDARPYPALIEEIVVRFNALAEIDLAYRELTAVDPQAGGGLGATLADDQGYLDPAPVGIGARWTWRHCMTKPTPPPGGGLVVCDLEQGWHLGHEDLPSCKLIYGGNRAEKEIGEGNHGTAVLGQLAGSGKEGYRVEGTAAKVADFILASHFWPWDIPDADDRHAFRGTNGHVAAAVANALNRKGLNGTIKPQLDEGDVLLLEVQRGLRPTEIDAADFDAVRLASALGVIVVEAAGNGGFNLDAYVDPDTGYSLNRAAGGFRDSGAIVVGAARAAVPHDRAGFSNYGSRLDCFAWGEGVTSFGYGNLAGQDSAAYSDYYTNTFGGTSSASPIIAGAAALVQALHVAAAAPRLRPRAMRSALSNPASGTRQGRNVAGYIGIMPDLERIVRDRLQVVPDVYLRRHVEDDGARPYTDDDISSSPDLILSPDTFVVDSGTVSAKSWFSESSRSNTPAPGLPFDPWAPAGVYSAAGNKLYVRMRNRGADAEASSVEVRLFASPAATLITPERWVPVGDPYTLPAPVLQGDLLAVGGPIDGLDQAVGKQLACLTAPPDTTIEPKWPAGIVPPFSLLAVDRPVEAATCSCAPQALLPPGPPYFDWAAHRRFLRGPGVAWCNAYAVQINPQKLTTVPQVARWYVPLAFFVAGTPDTARTFDFEIVQRLPKGAEVNFLAPMALAAKIRQRQPWFANGPEQLRLPTRHRTTVEGVQLPAGHYAPATFRVELAAADLLQPGHSLAIRQFWRGEEVGRITWWFVPATTTPQLAS